MRYALSFCLFAGSLLAQSKVNGSTVSASGIPANCVAASASGTAYTCSTTPSFTPATGNSILFQADVANTGSATLAVNGASAATIKKQGGGTNLVANDLLASQQTLLTFDGTNWQMLGVLGNAPSGTFGYALQVGAGSFNAVPANSSTHFIGALANNGASSAWSADLTDGGSRVYIPTTGTVKAVYLSFFQRVAASNETSTASFRLNSTTDTTISSAITNDSTQTAFNNSALSIAVNAGDFFQIKWVTPAWGTPPTNGMVMNATVYITVP